MEKVHSEQSGWLKPTHAIEIVGALVVSSLISGVLYVYNRGKRNETEQGGWQFIDSETEISKQQTIKAP